MEAGRFELPSGIESQSTSTCLVMRIVLPGNRPVDMAIAGKARYILSLVIRRCQGPAYLIDALKPGNRQTQLRTDRKLSCGHVAVIGTYCCFPGDLRDSWTSACRPSRRISRRNRSPPLSNNTLNLHLNSSFKKPELCQLWLYK